MAGRNNGAGPSAAQPPPSISEGYPPAERLALRETCREMVEAATKKRHEAKQLLDDAISKQTQNNMEKAQIVSLRKSEKAWEMLSVGALFTTFFSGAVFALVLAGCVASLYGFI